MPSPVARREQVGLLLSPDQAQELDSITRKIGAPSRAETARRLMLRGLQGVLRDEQDGEEFPGVVHVTAEQAIFGHVQGISALVEYAERFDKTEAARLALVVANTCTALADEYARDLRMTLDELRELVGQPAPQPAKRPTRRPKQ